MGHSGTIGGLHSRMLKTSDAFSGSSGFKAPGSKKSSHALNRSQ